MTVREVTIRVNAEDAAAKADLRELKMLKDSLAKPTTISVKLDAPSGFKLDKFVANMQKLNKLDARPTIVVDGLWQSLAGITMLEDKLKRLNGKTFHARMNVSVDQPNVRTDAAGGRGGGGGGGGFWSNTLKSFGGAAGNWFSNLSGAQKIGAVAGLGPVGLGLGISAAGIVASLIEALVPTLIGAGVGGIGLMGAHTLDPKAFAAVTNSLNQQFMMALTSHPNSGRIWDNNTGKANGVLVNEGNNGPSFLGSVLSILRQIQKFIAIIGPSLGEMFRASIPFIKMFAQVGEQAAKIMIPALTHSMELMKPYLPIIAQGFVNIVKGVAGFINALGPQGMKAGAQIFLDVTKVIEGAMIGLGHVIDFLAKLTVTMWHFWHEAWDIIRHDTAVAFDDIRHAFASFGHNFASMFDQLRHDVAHWWDTMWNDTIGAALRYQHKIFSDGQNWRHDIANTFDGLRHDIAHWWDMAWNDTIGAAIRFGHTVETKVDSMRSSIVNIVKKLPGALLTIGKQALSDFWNGMKAIAPNILNWAKNFIGSLGSNPFGLLGIISKHLGLGSPSRVMYQIGEHMMQGLFNGLKAKASKIQGAIGGLFGPAKNGSVVGWIEKALAITHSPPGWLGALERLVSLESGGNPRAVNSTPVGGEHATGLFQTLPSTFAAYSLGGSIYNPIADAIAGIRYIKARYGTPFNIPGLLSGAYHGYWGGGWVNEPVMGFGMRSGSSYAFAEHGPEYVSPGGSGGGVYNIYVLEPGYTDAQALRQIQTLKRYRKRHGNVALGLG